METKTKLRIAQLITFLLSWTALSFIFIKYGEIGTIAAVAEEVAEVVVAAVVVVAAGAAVYFIEIVVIGILEIKIQELE